MLPILPKEQFNQSFPKYKTYSWALATPHERKEQESHFNLSHWFWVLGQGVLTMCNTRLCAWTSQAVVTVSG